MVCGASLERRRKKQSALSAKAYLSACYVQCFLKVNVLAQTEIVKMQTGAASS